MTKRRLLPPDSAVVRVVPQRQESDCAIASFCAITGIAYEDALIAVARLDKRAGKAGLWNTQVQRLGKLFGVSFKVKRRPDMEADTGLLCIDNPDETSHMVVLKRGQIIETDGTVWDADVYLATAKATARSLLVMEGS